MEWSETETRRRIRYEVTKSKKTNNRYTLAAVQFKRDPNMYIGRLLFYDWKRRQDRNILVLIASTVFGHNYKGIWEDGSASARQE